jgi:hypothetical protein
MTKLIVAFAILRRRLKKKRHPVDFRYLQRFKSNVLSLRSQVPNKDTPQLYTFQSLFACHRLQTGHGTD